MLTTILMGMAVAAPVHGGELAGTMADNAYTLPAGTTRLQLAGVSHGLTDRIEIGASPLLLVGGPNVSAEVSLLSANNHALSVSAGGFVSWLVPSRFNDASAELKYTFGGPYTNRLTFAANVFHSSMIDPVFYLGSEYLDYSHNGVSARVSYDLVIDDAQQLQFSLIGSQLISQNIPLGEPRGLAYGIGYTRSWERLNLQVGVLTSSGGLAADLLADSYPEYVPLPYPGSLTQIARRRPSGLVSGGCNTKTTKQPGGVDAYRV